MAILDVNELWEQLIDETPMSKRCKKLLKEASMQKEAGEEELMIIVHSHSFWDKVHMWRIDTNFLERKFKERVGMDIYILIM